MSFFFDIERFKPFNAAVRWTAARWELDRIGPFIFAIGENANESPQVPKRITMPLIQVAFFPFYDKMLLKEVCV